MSAADSSPAPTDRLRVAVVGLGIGRSHLRRGYASLADRFEVMALCDIDRQRAEDAAEEHGVARVVTDFAEVCRMDDVDVVDICTPPHLHYEQILQVLEAGKHAVCEKPLVSSLREVDDVARAESRSGKRVMPIFQYRFGHGMQKLKLLMARGLTGQAYLGTLETAWRRRPEYYAVAWRGKWATERGGALLSHAIHNHDLLCYVLGAPRRLFAYTTTRVNDIEVEDCAAIALEMADGSAASSGVTLGSPDEISRLRFSFRGLVAESNTQPYTSSADPWTFVGDSPEITAQIGATLAEFQPLPEHYAGQFYRLYEALRTGGELPVTLADARRSIEMITAMYYSSQTGQSVSLPIGSEHPRYESWLPVGD
ncbi:MAG: Gfo/Idh/MocA family oxidoreductase [Chloroflexi bacterium]|nr:Gfo/Idh/MocA family oxidoreductase [Chloroflexota bacterium]